MKLLTANEELLVNGARAARSEALSGFADYFIEAIAENLSSTLNSMIYYGAGETKVKAYWNKMSTYYKRNPDLYNAVTALMSDRLIPTDYTIL